MGQEKRTMMKLSVSGECVALRTVSRGFRSPHRFVLLEKELEELGEKRYALSTDIRSFAKMSLERTDEEGNDVLIIKFAWLGDAGEGKLSGTEETLRFPWDAFREKVAESRSLGGAAVKLLAMKGARLPKVEFHSREHLKEVVERPVLRKKLGKLLANHLEWRGSIRIMVYDDFVPYSFCFREERACGTGLCGGIILHGQEDMKKAHYGIHT